MQLGTAVCSGVEQPVVVDAARGVVAVQDVWPDAPADLLTLITSGVGPELVAVLDGLADDRFVDRAEVQFVAPYRRPRKIWGIGLNYVDHAADLSEVVPDEPASFIKGDHTIIGPGEAIPIPVQSERTTAEGELGVVIGRTCRHVSEGEALAYVFGVTTVLDQTAEDILQRNPRFLTRAKNFPGFFSFGPTIMTLDEVAVTCRRLADLEVSTVVNGDQFRTNTVANMRYSPEFLISFHSAVMPLYPGDIISTGTPGAIRIRPGDVVECRIPGLGNLVNPVVAG